VLLKVQVEALDGFIAANVCKILGDQLSMTSKEDFSGAKEVAASQLNLLSVGTSMLYMESLLENFPPGERGLRLELPLGQCDK
jgi:hypothetical protein